MYMYIFIYIYIYIKSHMPLQCLCTHQSCRTPGLCQRVAGHRHPQVAGSHRGGGFYGADFKTRGALEQTWWILWWICGGLMVDSLVFSWISGGFRFHVWWILGFFLLISVDGFQWLMATPFWVPEKKILRNWALGVHQEEVTTTTAARPNLLGKHRKMCRKHHSIHSLIMYIIMFPIKFSKWL